MSLYAEVNGTTLVKYPYTFSDLQAENPYTDYGDNQNVAYWFPQTVAATELGYTLATVAVLPVPSYDPAHQKCVQDAAPTLIDGVWTVGWTVTDFTPEEQAAYDNQQKLANKSQAEGLLSITDWTAIPSVADPAQSNPYLANQSAFISYRSQVRAIAVNPPVVVSSWPTLPKEVWQTVTP